MKRLLGFVMALVLIIGYVSTALGVGFDIAEYKKRDDLYSVFMEEENTFIELDLTNEERNFSHKNDSKYYYNSIFSDIIVLNTGKDNEVAIPRVWVYYRTENAPLEIKNIEFSIYNTTYNFAIEHSSISTLDKGTVSEEAVVVVGQQHLDFLSNWWYAASTNKPIRVKLIGKADTVDFVLPTEVANAGMELFEVYLSMIDESIKYQYSETPVTVSKINEPISNGINATYIDDVYGMTFVIPNGWALVQNDYDEDGVSAKIQWASDDNSKHANIRYQTIDLYGAMIEAGMNEQEIGMSRNDINSRFLTKADFAEIMDMSEDAIINVEYGEYMYFATDITRTYDASPFSGSETITIKLYYNIDNGIVYILSFTGEESKFDDFIQLMLTVKHCYADR